MLASFSMSAKAAELCLGPRRGIAAFSALMATCRAPRFKGKKNREVRLDAARAGSAEPCLGQEAGAIRHTQFRKLNQQTLQSQQRSVS